MNYIENMEEFVFNEDFREIYFHHGCSQNWHMRGFHYHRNYEIILFMTSGATIQVENRSYLVKAGDLFVINDKEYHRTNGAKDVPYHRYVIMFYPDIIRQMEKVLNYPLLTLFDGRPEKFNHNINLSGDNLAKVVEIMNALDGHYSTIDDPYSRVSVNVCIMNLLITLQNLYGFFLAADDVPALKQTGNNKNVTGYKENYNSRKRIEDIKQYICKHVNEKIGLRDIADYFFMSPYHLSHYFKKETGFALFEYIKTQKMITAKALLKKGLSVTEIALVLGYSSDSHFISTFKHTTGTTPKKYALEKVNKEF